MKGRYFCADGRHIPEGHDFESCPLCLRATLDYFRKMYEANVNVDLVARLQEMDRRIRQQRVELARLNAATTRPASDVSVVEAFGRWCMPLDRCDRRFAAVAFRSGWQAARRAMAVPEDRPSQPSSVAEPQRTSEKK